MHGLQEVLLNLIVRHGAVAQHVPAADQREMAAEGLDFAASALNGGTPLVHGRPSQAADTLSRSKLHRSLQVFARHDRGPDPPGAG